MSAIRFLPLYVPQGVSPDIETGIEFDGATDNLSRGSLVGGADNKFLLVSFWIKRASAPGFDAHVYAHKDTVGGNGYILFSWETDDKLRVFCRRAAFTTTMLDIYVDSIPSDDEFHHFMMSANASTGAFDCYVDGIDQTPAGTLTDVDFDWTPAHAVDLGSSSSSSNWFTGCLAEFYLTNEYLDLSVESNRLKFFSPTGSSVVDLGSDGSTPTGTAPLVYLSGSADQFAQNFGTGGAFTVNGTPVDCVLLQYGVPGDVTHTLTSSAAMAVGRAITGDVTHTLTSSAAMAVERVITGDVTHTLTSAATFVPPDDNIITGDVTHTLTSSAAMAVGRAITGDVTHTLTSSAAMAVERIITGDVTHTLTSAAAMAVERIITGDVTHTMTGNAAMATDRVLVGSVTMTLTAAAAMAVERVVVGDVTHTLTGNAALEVDGAFAITGDVTMLLIPAAALQAALVHALTGDVTHTLTGNADMIFTPAGVTFLSQSAVDLAQFFAIEPGEQVLADIGGFMSEFGITCSHVGSADFVGILDDEFVDDLDIEGRALTLTAPTSACANIAENDTVTIGGAAYVAKTQRPDGTGITVMQLALPA